MDSPFFIFVGMKSISVFWLGLLILIIIGCNRENTVSESVTNIDIEANDAMAVVNRYLKVIGGRHELARIKSMMVTYKGMLRGKKVMLSIVIMPGNTSRTEFITDGIVTFTEVINEKEGYRVSQYEKVILTPRELLKAKQKSVLFKEQYYTKENISLLPLASIRNNKAYTIKHNNEKTYYDILSGLKIAESTDTILDGETKTLTSHYLDYRQAGNIKIPFKYIFDIGETVELTLHDYKTNENVPFTNVR